MANAARVHTLERGKDPHRFPLFAFGGAGPVHGYRIARALGSPAVIVPFGAGVISAVGFLTAPLAFDFVRSWPGRIVDLDWQKANMLLAEMEAEGQALLEASGVPTGQISHRREADIRYVGQGHEIRVPLPSDLLDNSYISTITAAFEEVYRRLYERLSPSVPIEIISWRVISSGPKPEVRLQLPPGADKAALGAINRPLQATLKGKRAAYLPEVGGYSALPVYDRYRLFPGESFSGPAIVEERESTIIVGPESRFRIDEQRNLIIELPSTL